MNRCIGLVIVSFLLALVPGTPSFAEDLATSLVGAWRLISCQVRASDGSMRNLYGESPLGMLMYDSSGHMSVHLMNSSLPKCGTMDRYGCPDTQVRTAFEGYAGYWGRYEVRPAEKVVLHYRDGGSVPDWAGTTLKRFVELSGNRLTITTPPQQVKGLESVIVLVWERTD